MIYNKNQQYPPGTQEKNNSFQKRIPVMEDGMKKGIDERWGGGKGEPGVPPNKNNSKMANQDDEGLGKWVTVRTRSEIVNRPKLMRESEYRQQALDFYANSTEEEKYAKVCENINLRYVVVSQDKGYIRDGNVYFNPRWEVKEKGYDRLPYDTRFVIMYCQNGSQIFFSIKEYAEITQFCDDHNDTVLFYIEAGEIKAHCALPANMIKINAILKNILETSDMQVTARVQCLYF